MQRANPYPPLLAEFNEAYDQRWNYFSFGYIGVDGRYHQLSYLSGEADTTPSLFVSKIRGSATNEGDFFTRYAFLITRETKPQPQIIDRTGKVTSWVTPAPIINWADWGTYEGGSYNGIEEIEITAFLALIEAALIGFQGEKALAGKNGHPNWKCCQD